MKLNLNLRFLICTQRGHTGFKLTQVIYKYQMTIGPVKAYQKLGKFEYFIHVNSQSFKGHELDINNINTLFYILLGDLLITLYRLSNFQAAS